MGRPVIARDTIRSKTIEDMRAMGIYRAEYDPLIDVYADMRAQYERLSREYAQGRSFRYTTPTADGGEKKSPLSLTLESLRRDILAYSDRLMLNPKARAEVSPKKKPSKLAGVLDHAP